MLDGYFVKKIGNHRGAPRVWIEGQQAEVAGFAPGQKYDVEVRGKTVVLAANKDGSRVVSSKKAGERQNPVIDLNSKELLAVFDGMSAVRVVAREGEIFLLPLASEIKKQERFARLREKLESGEPLAMGSLSFGGGVLSSAIHSGLHQEGVEGRLAFANEIREELLEHASRANDAWDRKTIPLAAPMQELAFDERAMAHLPKVEVMEMGLPCSGASRAGRSKRGLEHPEEHPEVGHLVVSALVILAKANPAIVVLENVPEYATSASASILRNQLRDLGYTTHEKTFNGREWGALENRTRWCMVAASEGIPFSFDQLVPPAAAPKKLGAYLDNIAPDDPRWSRMQGLKDKEVRDAAAGKGFKMQIFDADSEKIGTITKGYAKVRSTDPKIAHPTDPDLLRQLTPAEHARVKGVPERLVEGLAATTAHEILGQGIIYHPFEALGKHIAATLRNWDGRPAKLPAAAPEGLLELAGEVVAEIRLANPDKERLKGPIVAAQGGALIQEVGKNAEGLPVGVLHFEKDFQKAPQIGQLSLIEYDKGQARAKNLTRAPGRTMACG